MKGNIAIAIFLFLCLVAAPFINAAMNIENCSTDDDTGGSHSSGEAVNESSASTNSSNNTNTTDIIYVIRVAIYNVSELENDPELKEKEIDKIGSEKWENTGTYGMNKAIDSMDVWEYNGKKYIFMPTILEYYQIANGALESGNYKILLAPGDDDYFDDQAKPDGIGLKEAIRNFVENGGGYLGTCGGAEFACQGIRWRNAEGITEDSGLITLGIIDAYAYNAPPYTGNSNYFYRGIMYDSGSTEEGNGSGVSDWGGIPMINNFTSNAPVPFERYRGSSLTLRYWGGPWFGDLGGNAVGVAKYGKEPGDEPTTQLHYKIDGKVRNVTTRIEGEWSIIEQDRVNGKGRIVLFGCHPEHRTWEWRSGKIMENENYSQYIYAYPPTASNWNEIQKPSIETYDIVQEAAKWIVEPVLDNITETLAEYENSSDITIHFSFPDAPMEGDNYIPYIPSNPSPANNSINVSKNVTLSWHGGDFGGDAVEYYLTIKEMNSTNSTTICIDDPMLYIYLPPVSPFIEHILYHLDPAYANQDKLILRYQPDGEGNPAADYVQCKLYNLQSNTKYEWKVVAIDEKNATDSSEWWTFKTGG